MQGMTLRGRVIVDAREIFAAGQLYVMLSRVQHRDQLRIIGDLSPDSFQSVSAAAAQVRALLRERRTRQQQHARQQRGMRPASTAR